MKKKSDEIRQSISCLIREQELYLIQGNDDQLNALDLKIEKLRSKLSLVEAEESKSYPDVQSMDA